MLCRKDRNYRRPKRAKTVKCRFVAFIDYDATGEPVRAVCMTPNGGTYTHIYHELLTLVGIEPTEVHRVSHETMGWVSKGLKVYEVRA